MIDVFKLRTFAAALCVCVLLAGCEQQKPATHTAVKAESDNVIRGAGATFPDPLYQRWIQEYAKVKSQPAFIYEPVGSGEGVNRFLADEVDFGASDAAMTDGEIAKAKRGVKLIPTTAGMVVLAYNIPGLKGELRLSREAYTGIFLGEVRRWDDPKIVKDNPGLNLPNKTISVVVRRDSSGTTFAFTNHLAEASPAWKSRGPGVAKLVDWPGSAMTVPGNERVAQRVKTTENSIGYMEYVFANRVGLPMAALENKAGQFILPSPASGAEALNAAAPKMPENLRLFLPDPEGPNSYPMVSLTWLLLHARYEDATKARYIRDAVTWALGPEGQGIAESMGYIPVPKSITVKALRAVASIQ